MIYMPLVHLSNIKSLDLVESEPGIFRLVIRSDIKKPGFKNSILEGLCKIDSITGPVLERDLNDREDIKSENILLSLDIKFILDEKSKSFFIIKQEQTEDMGGGVDE